MEWEHKGLKFNISTANMGPLVMAWTEAQSEGPYVRVRPFSAIGTSEEKAIELLKRQITLEYRKVPELVG